MYLAASWSLKAASGPLNLRTSSRPHSRRDARKIKLSSDLEFVHLLQIREFADCQPIMFLFQEYRTGTHQRIRRKISPRQSTQKPNQRKCSRQSVVRFAFWLFRLLLLQSQLDERNHPCIDQCSIIQWRSTGQGGLRGLHVVDRCSLCLIWLSAQRIRV